MRLAVTQRNRHFSVITYAGVYTVLGGDT